MSQLLVYLTATLKYDNTSNSNVAVFQHSIRRPISMVCSLDQCNYLNISLSFQLNVFLRFLLNVLKFMRILLTSQSLNKATEYFTTLP